MEKCYLVTQQSNISKILSLNIERLYFGEGECEFNFLSFLRNERLLNSLFSSNKKLTLLTPHMSQISLKVFERFLESRKKDLISRVSEVVINDFGVYQILQSFFGTSVDYIYGNYLFNQQKDPLLRFSERPNKEIISIDYDMYQEFFQKNNIKALELYNPIHGVEIKNIQISCHIYYPYIVQSITRYCHRSLIYDGINYSKIVDTCSGCPGKEHISFEQDVLGMKVYSVGNKTLYTNYSIKHIDTIFQRIVYNFDIKK